MKPDVRGDSSAGELEMLNLNSLGQKKLTNNTKYGPGDFTASAAILTLPSGTHKGDEKLRVKHGGVKISICTRRKYGGTDEAIA